MSHRKPVEERGGHHALPTVLDAGELLQLATQRPVPRPPDSIRRVDGLVDRWRAVWTSPVAVVLDPVSDYEPMCRLFTLYLRGRQLDQAFERQLSWLEAGDIDQPFDPQFARVLLAFAGEIRQLEQTLGITPRGRLTIGAAVAAAGKALPTETEPDDADD